MISSIFPRISSLILIGFLLLAVALASFAAEARASVTAGEGQLVISQIYAGGSDLANSTYRDGFIEIFNRGTESAYLSGSSFNVWSGADDSVNSAFGFVDAGGYPIAPGEYRLIRFGPIGDVQLPVKPDFFGGNSLGFTGRVAITKPFVPSESGRCQLPNDSYLDFVAFGANSCFEGNASAPATSLTAALIRKGGGCIDTNDSSKDFVIGTPTPRNSTTPPNVCSRQGSTVTGRVVSPDGQALRSTRVLIVDASGVPRSALTSSFGIFRFDGVATGESHTISVSSKRYRFALKTITVSGDLVVPDLIGLE